MRIEFVGNDPHVEISGAQRLPGIANYFLGRDSAQWLTSLPTYGSITYQQIYPGIDLNYLGTGKQLKATYVVAPGADPSQIRWRYKGAATVEINQSGDLLIRQAVAEDHQLEIALTERAPIAWQVINGRQTPIDAQYIIYEGSVVGFDLGKYDAAFPLIIDPELEYSTYLGGSGDEQGWAIAVDSAGSVYVAGVTYSTNFPIQNAFQNTNAGLTDAFVTKLNPSGAALLYSTYIGSDGDDVAYGLTVDNDGNAYITGSTMWHDFPTTQGAYKTPCADWDAFVTKLNPSGNQLSYSTCLGGGYGDNGIDVAVDSSGNAYITGITYSSDFPTTEGAYDRTCATAVPCGTYYDTFLTRLNSSGSALLYSTFLGGDNYDEVWGIDVDTSGNAYVAGRTYSSDFPTTTGALQSICGSCPSDDDAFVTKMNANGTALIYSTYLGGEHADGASDIAANESGNAYVAGSTASANFPTTSGAFDRTCEGCPFDGDAFVAKFAADGSSLAYSTFLGGSFGDSVLGMALDAPGNVYLTGGTFSEDFPVTPGAFDEFYNGSNDIFVTKLNATGTALVYSTYLGGGIVDVGRDIAIDTANKAYITGNTTSTSYPITTGAFDTSYNGGPYGYGDVFITKIGLLTSTVTLSPSLAVNYASGGLGSFFTLTGTNFPASMTATIIVNDLVLTTSLPVDSSGSFLFILNTTQADAGNYYVTATVNPSATTRFSLDPNAPFRPQAGNGPVFTVPGGIAWKAIYIPLIIK